MTHFLNYILIPISKITPLENHSILDIRKIFGFNEWISAPRNIEIFNKYPGLREYAEKRFEDIFRNPKIINIDDINLLIVDCIIKFHLYKEVRLEEIIFHSKFQYQINDYDIVYIKKIQPVLAKKLPTVINNVEINPGSLHGASVIPLETIQKTDLDKFNDSKEFPETDDDLKGKKSIFDEIMNGIRKAKEIECDFFTYVG